MVDTKDLMLFWAKLGDGKYPDDAHPGCHLLDVGSVAFELWEQGLHSGFRSWVASGLNMTGEAAGRWIACSIAMHDIGELSPPFQRKSDVAALRLEEAGFRFPPVSARSDTVDTELRSQSRRARTNVAACGDCPRTDRVTCPLCLE